MFSKDILSIAYIGLYFKPVTALFKDVCVCLARKLFYVQVDEGRQNAYIERMKKDRFDISGMSCSACSAHVQKAVEGGSGITGVQVNLLTNSMTVQYDEAAVSPEDIIGLVRKAGYDAAVRPSSGTGAGGSKKERDNSAAEQAALHEKNEIQKRLILSIGFMLPLFYVSMGHMAGLPLPFFLHGIENAVPFAFTQFLLSLPVLIVNKKFFVGGFNALLRRAPNMDSLVAVGSGASVLYGIYAVYRAAYGLGHGDMETVRRFSMDLYFESAAMILTLVTLGKFLEAGAKKKTSQAITKLVNLRPKTASVIRDGRETELPIEEIVKGDIILIKPGASIPVDGTVIEGTSSVDESAVTGESLPSEKGPGDTVISASVNLSGAFTFRAERVGEDSAISQIIALVEEASASKAPVAKLADKISNYFVPAVIAVSLACFAVWLISGAGFEFAFSRAVAVLVISCPCALGLATPTAIMAGTGRGAGLGILIRSAEALETACKTDTVILDKTGTITCGRPEVVSVFNLSPFTEKEFLTLVYSLETLSEHPLAGAVIKEAEKKACMPLKIRDFKAEHGLGISGIAEEGADGIRNSRIFAGNEKFLLQNGFKTEPFTDKAASYADGGATPLLAAKKDTAAGKKELLGIIAVADKIKEGSAEAIREFKAMGIKTVMLTGDNEKTAAAIKTHVGVDSFAAGLLPQDKKAEIEKLNAAGKKTAMIGDGINDAPALMSAHIGMALGAGTDIAIESADIILMHDNLKHASDALQLSRAVMKNIKENLFWALFYNTLCIPIAAGALYPLFGITLNPMIAAAAMSLSSVSVVSNALRLNGFKPKRRHNSKIAAGDEPGTKERALDTRPADMEVKNMKTVLKVEGMACGHCTQRVEEALSKIAGVTAKADVDKKSVEIEHPETVEIGALKKAIEEAGYKPE